MRIEEKEKVVYLSQIFKFDKRNFDGLAGGALKMYSERNSRLGGISKRTIENNSLHGKFLAAKLRGTSTLFFPMSRPKGVRR
jgi:hypothetical protein